MRADATPLPALARDIGAAESFDAIEWGRTALGPAQAWPMALKSLVALVLKLRHPAFVLWGPDLAFIHNEAYRPILGERSGSMQGRPFFEVWPEVRDTIGPVIDAALQGEASFFEDMPVTLVRSEAPEQTWFTFSYTPAYDDDGRIAGVVCLCRETTASVLAEQRSSFLLELEGRLRPLTEPREVIAVAQQALGEHLRANRVGYGDVAEDERFFTTAHNWTDGTVEHHSGLHDLAAFGPPVLAAMRQGVTLRVNDATTEPAFAGEEIQAAFAGLEMKASLVISLVKSGRLTAALYVHQSTPRHWTDHEVRLVEEVAERTWSAVERARAENELRRSEARYREFFETAGDAIFIEDPDGRYVEVNAAACRLLGYTREELLGMDSRLLLAEGDAAKAEAWRRTGGHDQPSVADWRLRRKDGGWVEVEISAGPLSNGGVEAVVRDISARRAAEARQRLMLNELNHRVKNSLATVQAIAAQTMRRADVPRDVREAFTSRLIALAEANDVLIAEDWASAGIAAIARQVASPHVDPDRSERFAYGGPEVQLPPKSATAMALALHELATNAAKYGALSRPEGQVSLFWSVDATNRLLTLTWRERGGPPVTQPSRSGFGTRLIRQGLQADLRAKVTMAYEPEGLVCTITAPLPELDPGPLEV